MRKIDKEMPYANQKLLELVESQADGRVQKFAALIGLSQQRINRLFIRDPRNNQFPRMTEEIKRVVFDRFDLPWDYFTKPINEKEFESQYRLNGVDNMTDKDSVSINQVVTEQLENLTKEKLVALAKELILLHNEQTEIYRMLIRQNDEMIRNVQERFNNITNILFKNV